MNKKIGFTLIELIIVLAIIATLAAILITIVKPQQIFVNMRDTKRKSDLNNLSRAIDIYMTDMVNRNMDIVFVPSSTVLSVGGTLTSFNHGCTGSNATATIFYSAATVGGGPTPFAGFSGFRATNSLIIATSTNSNPPGWLPVPLGTSTLINLPQLPLDPRNANAANQIGGYYYTFACKLPDLYELNARLENSNDPLLTGDGGDNPVLYEVGPDKTILPNTTGTFFYNQ
jgi:prepilin-type N-terminal cleavage/methylation domain-containing protein